MQLALFPLFCFRFATTAAAVQGQGCPSTNAGPQTLTTQLLHSQDVGVETKDDRSPLTRADKEANAIICSGLVRCARVCVGGGGVALLHRSERRAAAGVSSSGSARASTLVAPHTQ